MQSKIIRLVLRGSDGHRSLTELAWREEWDLTEIRHTEPPFVEVWDVPGRDAEVHFVRDEMVGLEYVVFHGADVAPEVQQVRDFCPLWTQSDAIDALGKVKDRDGKLRAIYAAALAATGPEDDRLITLFRSIAVNEQDSGVRQAVIVSTGYLPWDGLIQLVSEMRVNDPESRVRNNAQVMLEGLRRHPPGTTGQE
ncbi:hypothetical protein AB0E64_25355 [Streptomyces caelestis]|jgi:hypothetical protein|uniref:HEAT repeat domain-containing protein n=1 Tax=Streptomyces caelestis TaxID=36816 RepID=A0A7W9H0D5_9ACTN|nr:hypothetical protein [Streptomyces caelestis]MBB5793028.1 hypothetical protein [Streptomyces caelestis]GGW64505.1 hypothetical protein GCM10010320_52260 [Streptomyces caelestis]